MYEVVKNVIQAGSYDLTAILSKIDTLWVQGRLTDDQRFDLVELARKNANTKNSVDVMRKLEDLDARVRKLEAGNVGSDNADTPEEYVPGKWYYSGDKVSFHGEVYTCTAPISVVCTWSPDEYPAYWDRK